MTTTMKAPGTPVIKEVWFKNVHTGNVLCVTVNPGECVAEALGKRKKRVQNWEMVDLSPTRNSKLHTVQSRVRS